jgi:glycine hydroxymethyltransferase
MNSKISLLIEKEQQRQRDTIDLIASENYASPAVRAATGSVLTNKYAEGYPGKRYYGGCNVIDEVELYAMDLGKKLFHAEHINVQPHSGSSANMAVYLSALKAGDTVLGMGLPAGGHLTHGYKLNFSGKLFNIISYGVSPETERIDYDEIDVLADQHKPKMIIAGASAYSRVIDFARIGEIAQRHGALFMADVAHIAGLIATGLHPHAFPYADVMTSTTHKTLRGPRGGLIACKADFAASIDRGIMPGSQGGPLMHVIAAKAVAFEEALDPSFKVYQENVLKNAQTMATAFQNLGYRIVSGGTENHLMLVDLRSKFPVIESGETVSGKLVEELLQRCNIVLNRNMIPFDTASPLLTSGIRIGTPAMTTRGFGTKESQQIVAWIDEIICRRNDEAFLDAVTEKIVALCRQFPVE